MQSGRESGDVSAGIAIVTGHSSGLGQALTSQLLRQGWTVIGVSRRGLNSRGVEVPTGLIEILGSVATPYVAKAAFKAAVKLGHVRLVANCAGVGHFGLPGTYTTEAITEMVESNLLGLIIFTDLAIRHMRRSGSGTIVNIMSTAAKHSRPEQSVYTATKAGAQAYTRTARLSLSQSSPGVHLIEVYPCGMRTDFWPDGEVPEDEMSYPSPHEIATHILNLLVPNLDSYVCEITFQRSRRSTSMRNNDLET